jgi:L-2-hydroxyglutarate oxidase LhgO
VRAQAVKRDGGLVDDFQFVSSGKTLHVLNVPSPAATASLMIGKAIAETAATNIGLGCLSDHPKPANEYHLKTGQRE